MSITPEELLRREWEGVDAPFELMVRDADELYVWTGGDAADPDQRTLECVQLPCGEYLVVVRRGDGSISQMWRVL